MFDESVDVESGCSEPCDEAVFAEVELVILCSPGFDAGCSGEDVAGAELWESAGGNWSSTECIGVMVMHGRGRRLRGKSAEEIESSRSEMSLEPWSAGEADRAACASPLVFCID